MSRVMGIDPGFGATGWAVVDVAHDRIVGGGCIRTQKSGRKVPVYEDDRYRLEALARPLASVVERYQPKAVAVEVPAGSQSSRAAICMGYAYAVTILVTQRLGIPVELVQAADAKKAVAGYRNATKTDVAAQLVERWPDLYQIATDAVAPALTKAEHVYDAAACVVAAWDSDLVRMARRAA